jgi:c-di-GMP-binding flagellar brake protein YcgR
MPIVCFMSAVRARSIKERRAFRVAVVPCIPVRFSMVMDEVKVSPIIDELGIGGARLMSVKHFDRFLEGERIGPATFPIDDLGTLTVFAIVKWKRWPQIGVEFVDMTEMEIERLFRYVFKVHRQSIRYERARKAGIRSARVVRGRAEATEKELLLEESEGQPENSRRTPARV